MIGIDQFLANVQRGRTVILYNSKDTDFRSFAFVLNVKRLIDADRIEIASGYVLRQAQKSEVEYIGEFLTSQFGRKSDAAIWETRPTAPGKQPKLPRKLWRYFVIEFGNDDPNLDLLEAALAVAPVSLDIGFVKLRVDVSGVVRPGCVYRAPSLFQSLSALNFASGNRDKLLHSPDKAEGKQIRDILELMAGHDHTILDLSLVVDLLLELKDLPKFSPLQILGYFAILESVLTHQPNPGDRYESITRQITQKLALLNRRWQPALDYSSFGGASHEKIWAKMYAYRSAIAHGRRPDFKSQLTLLKNADGANALIRDTVKKAIYQAFLEPQLMLDLHNV
jgi:hypothetical protein